MSTFMLVIMLSVSFSLVSYPVARAEEGRVAKACVTDIKQKCSGIQAGAGRVKDCVKEHFGELLTNCKAAVLKVLAIARACRSDIKADLFSNLLLCRLSGGRIQPISATPSNLTR